MPGWRSAFPSTRSTRQDGWAALEQALSGSPALASVGMILAIAAGAVFGFPLFTSVAMRHVEAVHASVMLGVLPLATALVGAWANRQRPSAGFWACAVLGTALVVAFAILRSGAGQFSIAPADLLLLLAMTLFPQIVLWLPQTMGYGMPK